MTDQLWTPPTFDRQANHRKKTPPKLGDMFGQDAAGREDWTRYVTLPGGGVMQFDLSRLTLADYRSMRPHYQVNISLALLTFMMHQVDWRIECDNKKIASFIEGNIRDQWTPLVRGMSQAYWAGYSPMAIQYENGKSGRIEISKFKDLLPEECRVNWKQVDGYAPPGAAKPKINVFDGIKQLGTHPIPVENSLWYSLLMENGDHYGRKLLMSAFPAWFFSQLMHLYSNRYFERFGEPLPIGRAPFDDEVEQSDGTYVSGRKAMENILTNIRNRSVVVLPNDTLPTTGAQYRTSYEYEIEYLESQMRGADFERYMTRLDEEISLALFTPLLMVRTADVGSYNLGVGHMQAFLWMHNALAGDFKQYLDNYVINRLVDFNFGENAPRARWVPKQAGKHEAELMRAVVAQVLSGGTAKVDLEEVGAAVGLTFTEVKQVTAPPAEPPPAGDPNDRDPDPRAGRARNDRGGERARPRGVNQARTTASSITNRIAGQVTRNFEQGKKVQARMGYRSQFEDALVADGADPETAQELTEALYGRMNGWLEAEAAEPNRTAAEFLTRFDAVLDHEIGLLTRS